MSKADLHIDWATHAAAKYACENWHYSGCMPVGKLVKVGAWERGKFIGVVMFGRGANKGLGSPFGLEQTEVCELVRIALTQHDTPVSRIMSLAIKRIRGEWSGMRLCVSFADEEQGHHGGIYQATNWIYSGKTQAADEYLYKGKRWHGRAFRKVHGSHLKYLDKGLEIVNGSTKHRYLMPLDAEMRERILPLAKPYPKRAGSIGSDATDSQSVEGGATPTPALSLSGGADAKE